MRILLLHNYYGSSAPSGENAVFRDEKEMLSGRGHSITEFSRHSDEIRRLGTPGLIKGALSTPWNPIMAHAVRREVDRFRPDVVHVHNTFPLLSPAVFHSMPAGTARVLTLHNYRLFCPAAIPMRSGQVCTECLDERSSAPSIRYGCYRGSRLATLPLAASVWLARARGTWLHHVDGFIALSDFQASLMVDAGLPKHKVFVKPNFYPGAPSVVPWRDRSPYAVFVGRLSAEKGVIALIEAWRLWGCDAPELRVVGDGELRPQLEKLAQGLPIRFIGQVASKEAETHIANARLMVLPSEWFEGFPMVLREAFAFGTPAAVSNLGPLPSIVEHDVSGVVFQAANPTSLVQEVRSVWVDGARLERLGVGARMQFEEKYNESSNYEKLMEIYESAARISALEAKAKTK